MAKIMKTIRQRRTEKKTPKTYPGSSVKVTDTFGANITAFERMFEKLRNKKAPPYKRTKKRGPR